MRRVGFLLIVLALVAGCDDDNPNGPTSGAIVFTATLLPANEVPPITSAENIRPWLCAHHVRRAA